jgi:hypothetical protein
MEYVCDKEQFQGAYTVNKTNSLCEYLTDSYESPGVKVLREILKCCLPGLSLIDEAIAQQFGLYRENKLRTFFDELDKGNREINDDLIKNNDFLHAYFSTVNAVLHSRTDTKIKLFARALERYTRVDIIEKADEYQELILILLDLSDTEMRIIGLLDKNEAIFPRYKDLSPAEKYSQAQKFWKQFEDELSTIIPANEFSSRFVRLERTGLVNPLDAYILDGGEWGREYIMPTHFLTHMYYRLRDYFTTGEYDK